MKIIHDDILHSEIEKMKKQGESKFDHASPLFPRPGTIKACAKPLTPYLDIWNMQYKSQILKIQIKSMQSTLRPFKSEMTNEGNQQAIHLSSNLPTPLTPDRSRTTNQPCCFPSCNIS